MSTGRGRSWTLVSMTGSHADHPIGHGQDEDRQQDREERRPEGREQRRRPLAWRIGTPAVVLLCGGLLAVSAANSDGTDLRPGRYTDLAGLVKAEAQDYQRVERRFTSLSAEVDRLGAGTGDEKVVAARRSATQLRDPAGLTPRRGPGVRITLSDAPEDLLDAAVAAKSDNLNRYVVHQQDIQAVVNALWNGGASAVTIAGQRVISTTGIKCRGNAVQLQGVPYPQPYVIEAVGDPAVLEASVDADRLVAGYREDAADPLIGIGWAMEGRDEVDAPAFRGVIDLQYARPLR